MADLYRRDFPKKTAMTIAGVSAMLVGGAPAPGNRNDKKSPAGRPFYSRNLLSCEHQKELLHRQYSSDRIMNTS